MRGMIKTLSKVRSETKIQGHTRLTLMFDLYFVYIEPNSVKRRKKLNRIFKFQPTLADKSWVDIIRVSYRKALRISKNNYKQIIK